MSLSHRPMLLLPHQHFLQPQSYYPLTEHHNVFLGMTSYCILLFGISKIYPRHLLKSRSCHAFIGFPAQRSTTGLVGWVAPAFTLSIKTSEDRFIGFIYGQFVSIFTDCTYWRINLEEWGMSSWWGNARSATACQQPYWELRLPLFLPKQYVYRHVPVAHRSSWELQWYYCPSLAWLHYNPCQIWSKLHAATEF